MFKKILILFLIPTLLFGADTVLRIKAYKSPERTAETVQVPFKLTKVVWDGTSIKVYASVKNTTVKSLNYAKVTIFAIGKNGKAVSREWDYLNPNTLRPGDTAFLEMRVNCHGMEPRSLKYIVEGS